MNRGLEYATGTIVAAAEEAVYILQSIFGGVGHMGDFYPTDPTDRLLS